MSNIDKRALREAAENANADNHTQDEWFHYLRCSTPGTVLALLDELEAVQTVSAARLVAIDTTHKMFQRERDRAEAAERRIAEMEARDKPKFVQCWSCKHDIEVLAIADCDGYCPRCAAPIDLDDEPYAAAGKGE